jgi:hypothetical protein
MTRLTCLCCPHRQGRGEDDARRFLAFEVACTYTSRFRTAEARARIAGLVSDRFGEAGLVHAAEWTQHSVAVTTAGVRVGRASIPFDGRRLASSEEAFSHDARRRRVLEARISCDGRIVPVVKSHLAECLTDGILTVIVAITARCVLTPQISALPRCVVFACACTTLTACGRVIPGISSLGLGAHSHSIAVLVPYNSPLTSSRPCRCEEVLTSRAFLERYGVHVGLSSWWLRWLADLAHLAHHQCGALAEEDLIGLAASTYARRLRHAGARRDLIAAVAAAAGWTVVAVERAVAAAEQKVRPGQHHMHIHDSGTGSV